MNRKAGLGYTVPLALFMFILILTVAFSSVLFMKSVDMGIKSRTLDMAVALTVNEAEKIRAGIEISGTAYYDRDFLPADEADAAFVMKVTPSGDDMKETHISFESSDGNVIYEIDIKHYMGGRNG